MGIFGTNQKGGRLEDQRFLTGAGRYTDDIAPADALHAVFLRAPLAHGRITSLDLGAARAAPGVHAVLDASSLRDTGLARGMSATTVTNTDGTKATLPPRPLMADGHVRFTGEAVAMIVADTALQARDAAERIVLDIEPLPVALALEPNAATIHPEAPQNVGFDWALGDPQGADRAFADAAHVVRMTVTQNRVFPASMEPRAAFAEWDGNRLHLAFSGQGVWGMKQQLAEMLALPEDAVRVTNPDVGGGFGMKGMAYPEYFVIAHAARELGHPVRWQSDRSEAALSDNAGRDLVTDAALAFDADHRILAYRVDTRANLGAYSSEFAQPIQSELFAKVLTGAYDITCIDQRARGIYTNTAPVDAYRGAGRPESITVLERIMDHAARELGTDPLALRLRNFIAPEKLPYRSASGELYDTGDFARVLERARKVADIDGFSARRAGSEGRGQLRGLGLAYYIESILGSPWEGAEVHFLADGTVAFHVGTQSNGQGHETVYTRFLAAQTGLPESAIRIVQGDSDAIAQGGGTGGSRSVTVQATATLALVEQMIPAFNAFLADALDVPQVEFADGTFRADGSNRTVTLLEAAELARAQGRDDLLRHATRAKLPGRSYPNGAHLAEVEIDPETGAVALLRYTAVDDFGVLMNPTLAAGQVHGGVAQGYGQAVCENVAFDADGQLLTGSFMDYAMPRAGDLPFFDFYSEPVPSTANPLGMKGCGEAGTVGALAAISNAVRDALAPLGVAHVDMPFTPNRVWGWINAARAQE